MRRLLLTLALTLTAHAQDKPDKLINVTTFSNRAVTYVATHTTRNPGAFLSGTERPISLAGKWSVRRYATGGCTPEAVACVAVLYTTPDRETVCEWTVQIAEDPKQDAILALNAEAARDYLLRLSSTEALQLSASRKQPAFIAPAILRSANLSGANIVLLTIDTEGRVSTLRTLSGLPLVRDAIEDTFKHWRFDARRIDGKPIASFAYAKVDVSSTALTMHFLDAAPPKPAHK